MASLAIAVVLAACGADDSGSVVRSDAEPVPAPPSASRALEQPAQRFAGRLYAALAARQAGNLAVSPVLVIDGLAMVGAGAQGATAHEIDALLGTEALSDDELLAAVAAQRSALADATGEVRGPDRQGRVELDQPSAMWLQRGTVVAPELLDQLAERLDRGVRLVDFRSDPDAAGEAISRWAEDETDGAIRQLAPRGAVSDASRVAVTSALAYEAPWAVPFDVTRTETGTFTPPDGTVTRVAMLRRDAPQGLRAADEAAWQAVEVPYLGDELAMVLLVPRDDDPTAIDRLLAEGRLPEVLDELRPTPVALTVPRFAVTTEVELVPTLNSLGLATATDVETAQLDGIAAGEQLALTEVIQQTYVGIDEEGTSTSAATVTQQAPPLPTDLVTISADRPFSFVVLHRDSGTVLLIGRVTHP